MIEKPADSEVNIEKVIAERWSGRAYDPAIAVDDDAITSLCEAARWAPSCFGDQPWRFVVWNKFADEASWQQALECLAPGNQEWAKNAPILVLAASVNTFSHNGSDNKWVGYDTGAASISLCLQATALGLMTHQMGGFDANKIKQLANAPEDTRCWAMIAIGYPADLDSLTEEQLERELSERQRRPLKDQFFSNTWNSPVQSGE